VLAKRVASARAYLIADCISHDCPHGCAMREQRRLRIQRRREIVSRSLEAKRAQLEIQSVVDFLEYSLRFRKSIREVFPHSSFL
jgi:hypothetical protein